MKLKLKLTLIIVLSAIIFISAVYIISNYYIIDKFYTLENKYHHSEFLRLEDEYNRLITSLDSIVYDYAKWDDTYNYIATRDSNFIESNFDAVTFENFDITQIVILDSNNDVLNSFDYNGQKISTVNDIGFINIIKQLTIDNSIVHYNDNNYIVSKMSIQDSKLKLPSNGFIVFCKQLPKNYFSDKFTRQHYTVETLNNVAITNQVNLKDYYTIKSRNKTKLYFYKSYSNINNKIKFTVTFTDDISTLGVNSLDFFTHIFLFMIVILSLGVAYISNKFIIGRIEKLSSSVKNISYEKNLSRRVEVEGHDEISDLAQSFNDLLIMSETMNSQLTNFATLDNLTHTYNRRVGFDKLNYLIKNYRLQKSLSIAFLDLDDLKTINDTYGHNAGDQLIVKFCELVQKNLRTDDTMSRLGGDEFLIILPNTTISETHKIMKRINININRFNETSDLLYPISFSYGIESYDPNKFTDLIHFIESADNKMYQHKKDKKSKLK